MKYISIKICLVIVALFGVVAGASDLPDCPSDQNARRHNCFGTLTWANGDIYVGEFKDDKSNGQGTYTHSPEGEWAGHKYVGEFKDDKTNGQGFRTFPNGNKYLGEEKDGKKHGYGTLTWANGDIYVGEYKDDKSNGQGTYTHSPEGEWAGHKYVGEWKDGKTNGQGFRTFPNGIKYLGEEKDGKKHGHGTLTFADGKKYVGEWKDDEMNGQGTYIHADGTLEGGIWKDGEFQYAKTPTTAAVGTCLTKASLCSDTLLCQLAAPDVTNGKKAWFSSSSDYYKYVVEAKKRGLTCGVESSSSTTKIPSVCSLNNLNACPHDLVCKRGSRLLEGKRYWDKRSKWIKYSVEAKRRGLSCGVVSVAASDLSDCPSDTNVRWHNCFGTYTWSDGDKYVGEWKDNKRTGQGTKTYANGSKYVGEFKDNERTGQGTYTWPSGNKYVGEYNDGKRTGQGTFTWASGSKYVGEYKDGKRTGQGTFTWSDGDKYVGEFKDNERTGQGTFTLASGSKYVGEFKDGNFNAQGTYTHANGKVEEGTWQDNKLNGQATVTYADGTVEEGIWKDDEFQYAKAPTKPVPVVKAPTQDDQAIPASSGSGFAVSSDGYVITNSHVIEGCQDVVIHTPLKDVKMRVVSNDPKNDLALLKGDFTPLSVFSLSTKRPEILQDIYVAGYPFGYKVSSSVKVTKGIISSLTGIGNDFSNIQIDAALQSGNSGGPILDDMGNVVGVAVAKLDLNIQILKNTANIPENTNFGIKASVVRSVLDSSSVDTPSANTSAISKSQLGKMITNGTYYISCWMTLAQIEKVRSKKVLFSELD